MDTKTVIRIAIGSFLVGTINQAYYEMKQQRKLEKQNEILRLENELLHWYVKEAPFIEPREEMLKLLEEKETFLRIAKNMK